MPFFRSRSTHIALIKSYAAKPWRSPHTFQLIEDSLRERWPVTVIEANTPASLHAALSSMQQRLREKVFVFNIAEYLDEQNKSGFVPALLDAWHLHHLGSSAECTLAGLNKHETKSILLEHGIPTPPFTVIRPNAPRPDEASIASELGFPLIVKPSSEGGHIGINDRSVVRDVESLAQAVSKALIEHKRQSVLVERFVTGPHMREFSVGIVDGEQRLFAPIEIDYDAMAVQEKILSFETAQHGLERTKPVTDPATLERIQTLAACTFDALDATDYARVDLRMDDHDCYVLEINIMPGLGPHSFLPQAMQDQYGFSYAQLIQKLVESALHRVVPSNFDAASR